MKSKSAFISLWILTILVLAALHFVHLQADFPNYSPWMDWSKYTDEGWYANAAIQHYLKGSWYVPHDFNAGAAVPVWPFLEAILFRFTGVTVQAARGLAVVMFCCNLGLSYQLVRKDERRWVALFASSLIAASPLLYCFTRLAILEPLLVCLALSSLLLARSVGSRITSRGRYLTAALMGALFCLMILTKTTAVFLLPSILYMLWFPLRKDRKSFVACAAAMGVVAACLWSAYFFLLVRPHYLADYHYFFRINVYQKPNTIFGWLTTLYYSLHGILWVDRTLVLTAIALLAATAVFARSVWRNPLFVSSLLAIGGYVLFIAYIDNMQPRYYAVVAFFLFFILALASAALLRERRSLGIAAVVVASIVIARDAWVVGGYTLYPEYTFVNAAKNLTRYINEHPNGKRLLVSISGNQITLVTGLPSLCDDFGTIGLPEKLALYQPGWYAAWNELDAGTVEDIQTHFSLEEVAHYKAFDDDDRDTLVLYKLHPLPEPGPGSVNGER